QRLRHHQDRRSPRGGAPRPVGALGPPTPEGRRGMNTDDILRGLYDETLVGNGPRVLELTHEGLDAGLSPESMLFDALIPSPEKVSAGIQEHKPDIVVFSAFLTTTMPMFKANINALQKAGLRDQVIVMVGGAPVTQEYADAVGADGYAADASTAVRKAKELLAARRATVGV